MGKGSIEMKPKVIILRASGTNCDLETRSAFDFVGARTELVHINELLNGAKKLVDYDIMAIPGGFSFGDDISAGKIFALRIKKLKSDFNDFIKAKKPLIGICNGFQVLVKTGFLPYDIELKQRATLYSNDVSHFICRWVKVRVNKNSPCIFTKGLPDEFYLPIAHGEGKFISTGSIISDLKKKNLDALLYLENPNGSYSDIAGITNNSGNVFGLMPHPERVFFSLQQPWKNKGILSIGYEFFKNAVNYARGL
jgi:phosphoribosylformylglycinamidine synthase I